MQAFIRNINPPDIYRICSVCIEVLGDGCRSGREAEDGRHAVPVGVGGGMRLTIRVNDSEPGTANRGAGLVQQRDVEFTCCNEVRG